MSLDKLINHLIDLSVNEQKEEPVYSPSGFKVFRRARDLIESCRNNAAHHRDREKHYTEKLEKAEAEFREKGVKIEVWDPSQGYYLPHTSSGSIGSGQIGGSQQMFQPKIDQTLQDAVKHAKTKMLEHRNSAEQFEKYVTAFSIAPETLVELSVGDIHYFRLGK